ncbi:hypothetical protein HanIR_Chr13g0630181 [Helianthus annuus]|nr:hypothetical protein HanIR_Chr13g0630181 [Helianthus annuus]
MYKYGESSTKTLKQQRFPDLLINPKRQIEQFSNQIYEKKLTETQKLQNFIKKILKNQIFNDELEDF